MKIGEKIKALRKQKNITQEKLAAYLNVTCQAVSKWENGTATPDLQLIVPLANFFNVSTDELFCRSDEIKQADLEEYRKKDEVFSSRGETKKSIELWRGAVSKYPNNFECLCSLAYCLFGAKNSSDFTNDQEVADKYTDEAIEICERILNDCTENEWRDGARQMLVMIYGNPHYGHLDTEKAKSYAEKATGLYCSREMLLMHAYGINTEEHRLHQHQNTLTFLDCLTQNIIFGNYKDTKEKIFALNTALNLWNSVIYDGNFLFYHCRMAQIYRYLAIAYGKEKDSKNVMESLIKAKYHAVERENIPDGEQFYTGAFVNKASHQNEKTSKNFTCTELDLIADILKNEVFDFIKESEEFFAFEKSLK